MRILFAIVTMSVCCFFSVFAQEKIEIVSVEGEHTVQWYQEKESKEEAQKRAEKYARVNALEKAFGTVIVQGNSTYVKNVNTGQKVETKTSFSMIGNTTVGGEIVEVLKCEFKEKKRKYKKGREKISDIFITCQIKIHAKKLSEAKINFEAATLATHSKKAMTERYKNGDDMFFYFRTPVSGYLSIYVDITGSGLTQRILPYSEVPPKYENGMFVKADQDYIFFSGQKEHDYFAEDYVVPDEIVAAAEADQELWRFFIIFSKEPLNKPKLKEGMAEDALTLAEQEKKYTVPKEIKSEDFQRWLIRNLSIRDDFQREIIDVVVEK